MRQAAACAVACGTYKGLRMHVLDAAHKEHAAAANQAAYSRGEAMPAPAG